MPPVLEFFMWVGVAFGLVLGWSIIIDVVTKDSYDEERFPRENIYDDTQ